MIRVIAAAGVLAALVGSIAIYSKNLAEWRASLPFGALDRGTEAAIKPEAWPICTTMDTTTTQPLASNGIDIGKEVCRWLWHACMARSSA